MFRLMSGVSVIAMSSLFGLNAAAQDAAEPEEKRLNSVTVTATKRTESAQSIPVAVNALGEQVSGKIDEKNALGEKVSPEIGQNNVLGEQVSGEIDENNTLGEQVSREIDQNNVHCEQLSL